MYSLGVYLKNDFEDFKHYFSCTDEDMNVVEDILKLEWDFFDKVKGLNGRASCQDDYETFLIMRLAQHMIFSYDTRKSILADYKALKRNNINPIEGKYARMMKYTDEELYRNFLNELPEVSPLKSQMIIDIIKIFEKDLNKLEDKLPITISNSRPKNNENKSISSLSYFYAELTFFSYRTLRLMKKDVSDMRDPACVERIFQNTVIINNFLS